MLLTASARYRNRVLALGLSLGIIALTFAVVTNITLHTDEDLLRQVHRLSSPVLDTFFLALTQSAGDIGALVSMGLVASLFWFANKSRPALFVIASMAGAGAINQVLKVIIQRPRPALWDQFTEIGYSFPSWHAMLSAALALTLIVIFWPTRWRWLVLVGGGAYMILVGLSRLYLAVHYPSDILAAWLMSGLWVLVAFVIVSRYFASKEKQS
jgi:undecaprenyl-diphosphatase